MKTKTINDLCLSDHLRQERADRMVEILSTVGIGTVKWIVPSTKNPDVIYRFSTTGIIFVCSKSNDMVMTAYLVNKSKAYAVFNGKPPKEHWKKILENEKKGLTHDQGYVIIALERNKRKEMIIMTNKKMLVKLSWRKFHLENKSEWSSKDYKDYKEIEKIIIELKKKIEEE